jgi:hypothetical protein
MNITNQELRALYTTPDLIADINMRRLTLLRHVVRIDQRWLRIFLKDSQEVEEKWEGPNFYVWKRQRMIW